MTEPPGEAARDTRAQALRWALVVVIGVALTVAIVLVREHRLVAEREARAEEISRGPRVLVTPVRHAPESRVLRLPASIHGFIETPVYAKIAGYLKEIHVDKGDRVKKGDLLAVLEAPELDKQVADARANYWLQKATDARNQKLVPEDSIALQLADESHAAMLRAQASYEQLLAMQAYERISAPFDALVTARYVDPGVLVPEVTTPAGSSSTPILALATLQPVRVYADVPQDLAQAVRDGDPATVSVAQFPGRRFEGSVTRHPDALAPSTRTMLVEVDLPNADKALLPGMYGQMEIQVRTHQRAPLVPDDALVFRDGKIYVPIVSDDRVHLAEVTLGSDDGHEVEIIRGIDENDLVVINLGQAVHDGERVQPIRVEEHAR